MSEEWRQAYTNLTDFVIEHPEVEIGASRITLPESTRPEFYRFFNAARTSFIGSNFPEFSTKATILSQNYLQVEQDIIRLLGLEDISMDDYLIKFLRDPIDQLKTGLFNPLFDLLQAKVDIETLEKYALKDIKTTFEPLYQSGYKIWVALSLVKLLEAARLFQVTLPPAKNGSGRDLREFLIRPKWQVPSPVESSCLSFEQVLRQQPCPVTLIVPDLIVYSSILKRYFALRLEMGKAISYASDFSERREWYSFGSVLAFESRFILVYTADNPVDIALVADGTKICRPDLIIECKTQKGWYQSKGLDEIMLHHGTLKPVFGTYIVSEEPVPGQACKEMALEMTSRYFSSEQGAEERGAGIHLLTASFDQLRLEPIVKALMNTEVTAKE